MYPCYPWTAASHGWSIDMIMGAILRVGDMAYV